MAECDGKSVSLQFAVPIGHCGGICQFLCRGPLLGLRRIAMDFLRNGGAAQRVKSQRSWSTADQGGEYPSVATQPLAIGEHVPVTAHSIYHFRRSDGRRRS